MSLGNVDNTADANKAVLSAGKWTTARNLANNSVDGSANVAFANKFVVQGTTDTGLSGAQFLGALSTGIVKNTTTTGVLSIAAAGDFPTLNQSTTGSAATLTTGRTVQTSLSSTSSATFDGSANITPGVTGTLAVANGGTGQTALVTAATASTVAARDANANLTVNAVLAGFTTTVTAAGTTTLTIASTPIQEFTGTLTQTVVLPTTSISAGQQFMIINNSTGAVAVQSSSLAALHTIAPNTEAVFTALVATPTTAAHWEDSFFGTNFAAGKKLTVNNTLTLATTGSTDSLTMTFPSTDATIARTDAANTFTGVQTMTSPALTTPAITGTVTGTYTLGGTPTLTNPTITNYTEGFVNIGTVAATNTIALTSGTVQHATLTASTATTFTMPAVGAGKSFTLMLKQPAATGAATATFTSVKWGTSGAPTITAGAGKMDILSFFSDGTNWYGSAAQGYTY